MINRFTTLQRVLFCLGMFNIIALLILNAMIWYYDIDEKLFSGALIAAGVINFFWVWFLLRRSFNSIKQVTEHLKMIRTDDIIKIEASGHQKEINELIHAFNTLADEVHNKAKAAEKIIKSD